MNFGFLSGRKMPTLARMPLAHEANIIARAQSLMTRNGVVPEPPSYEEAQRIIARANKPRIRLQVTVPEPLREPSRAASAPVDANPSSSAAGLDDSGNHLPASPDACSRVQVGAGRQSIHRSPCACGDDAQRHYALIARDLMTTGRADELTDDMRQAYDYEFGGVQEPEPPQIPEF